MGRYRIPFNRAVLTGRELEYVRSAIEVGHISGNGEFTKRCEKTLETELGAKRALLTTSCTDALEMAALLLDLKPGDEVAVPAFTFVSTATAFALRGAKLVFVDSDPETMNMSPASLAERVTSRTKAVVPVHYAGVGCDMDAIMALAADKRLAVVEDNAHGLFGRYRGRPLGSFGALSTLSFHETKNITCGEGGALIVNDEELVERAEIVREKGTNRSRFLRGQVDKYTWVDLGSSHLPSDILAAFLQAQLESREKIQEKRKRLWTRYREGLGVWANTRGVGLPKVPPECEQAYHMFYLMTPSAEWRQSLIKRLADQGILSVFHYQALNRSPAGEKFGGGAPCPVAEAASERLLRLPFYNDMTDADQDEVIGRVVEFAA